MNQDVFYDDHQNGRNSWYIWVGGFALAIYLSAVFPYHFSALCESLTRLTGSSFFMWLNGYHMNATSFAQSLIIRLSYEHLTVTVFLGLGIYIAQRKLRARPLSRLISQLGKFRWRRFWAAIAVFIAIYLIFWLWEFAGLYFTKNNLVFENAPVIERMGIVSNPQGLKVFFWGLPFVLIGTTLNAAFQELLFRGFLEQGLFRYISMKPLVFVISAALFSIWHYHPANAVFGVMGHYGSMFIFGLMMSLICFLDNGLEAAIGIHIVNNVFFASVLDNPDYGFTSVALFQDTNFPVLNGETLLSDVVFFGAIVIILAYWRFGLSRQTRARDQNG